MARVGNPPFLEPFFCERVAQRRVNAETGGAAIAISVVGRRGVGGGVKVWLLMETREALVEYGGLSVDGGKYVERAYSIIETRNLNLKSGENCKFFSSSSFLFSWLFFRF